MTIIKQDNAVYINGIMKQVDCSSLPENFWALQWYDTWGEIEYSGTPRPQNVMIQNIDAYKAYFVAWNKA